MLWVVRGVGHGLGNLGGKPCALSLRPTKISKKLFKKPSLGPPKTLSVKAHFPKSQVCRTENPTTNNSESRDGYNMGPSTTLLNAPGCGFLTDCLLGFVGSVGLSPELGQGTRRALIPNLGFRLADSFALHKPYALSRKETETGCLLS